jgi:hypothetical protein
LGGVSGAVCPGRYSATGSRNLTLWNLPSFSVDPVNQVKKVLVSEFG